jgi:hypothetical protein
MTKGFRQEHEPWMAPDLDCRVCGARSGKDTEEDGKSKGRNEMKDTDSPGLLAPGQNLERA